MATSGISRALSFGTPGPACQSGFAIRVLGPPPLDNNPSAAEFSFHASSGIHERADPKLTEFVADHHEPETSSNWVPPTPVTSGRLEGKVAARPRVANAPSPWLSQPAAPESPEAESIVMPCALACWVTAR